MHMGISWASFADRLQDDADLRDRLTRTILSHSVSRGVPAIFWESVPVARDTRNRPYEMQIVAAPGLAKVRTGPEPFEAHLKHPISCFDNLGRDARLVAPSVDGDYPHLAAFLLNAPASKVHELWQHVGREVVAWWDRTNDPVWVSTSGLGVHWLHVRLDNRPKYYTHAPYRTL